MIRPRAYPHLTGGSGARGRRRFHAALWLVVLPALAAAVNTGLGPPPAEVDRRTPLATVQGFTQAAYAGKYALAAQYLNLDWIPQADQPAEGSRLSRRLKFVLNRQLPIDFSHLSKEPQGSGGRYEVLGYVPRDQGSQPIQLERISTSAGPVWVFSADTVKAIDALYDQHGPPLADRLPEFLYRASIAGLEPWQWLGLAAVLALATALALLLERLLVAVGARLTKLTTISWDDQLVAAARGPLKLPLWSAVVAGGTRSLLLPPAVQHGFDLVARSLVIIAVAWFALRALMLVSEALQNAIGIDAERSRGVRTQLAVLRRVFEVAIYVVGAALLLLQFDVVRNVGVSLLASAGIATLVIGLAAQKSVASLLAGIQLSITQPIRIGDTVVVEGEYGTVEEITLSYVVLKSWDLRRIVVPISFFTDKKFENWSKGPPALLGTVTLEVDYTADVEAFRREFRRILENEGRSKWDGKTASLVVLNASDRTAQLRAVVGSPNADDQWDLRCLVREKLVAFLGKHEEWMPKARAERRDVVASLGGPNKVG